MKKIKKYDIFIILLFIIGIVFIGPVGVIKNEVETSSAPMISAQTDPISNTVDVKQYFIPKYKHIKSIGIVPVETSDINGKVYVDVCTTDNIVLKTNSVDLSSNEGKKNGYRNVELPLTLKPGEIYYFRVYTDGDALSVNYRSNEAGPEENFMLLYDNNGIGHGDNGLAVRYVYRVPLKSWQFAFYFVFMATIAFIVREEINKYGSEKTKRDN